MTKQYKELSEQEQEILPFRDHFDFLGVEASDEMLEWVWNKKLSIVGSDNIAFEPGALTCDDRWDARSELAPGVYWGVGAEYWYVRISAFKFCSE